MAELYWYNAHCVKVVDGDTIDLDVDLGFGVHVHDRFRLARINAPETYRVAKTSPEYVAGLAAKNRLIELVDQKDIVIHTKKDPKDKYGRYLAEIYVNDQNVNDLLLTEKLVLAYKE